MRSVNCVLITLAGMAACLPGFALTWEKTSLDFTMEAGTGELIAEFPFKNEGPGTVTIRELKSSCGCSTPTVKSRTIIAGESGVVRVAYVAGDRVGLQTASLTVATDEADMAPASLHLKIDIQPVLIFTPRLVHWTRGEEAAARTIAIKQSGKSTVRIVAIKPDGDALAVELKSGAEPGTWGLTLTPKVVSQPSMTRISILVEIGDRKATYTVFGIVR